MIDLSVVIPIHNERDNLPRLLAGLREECARWDFTHEIVAVDDGSSDESPRILADAAADFPELRIVRRAQNSGMGAALMDGTREARGEMCVWMMADLSDRLSDIPAIRRKLLEGFDLVIASRAMPGGNYGKLGQVKARLSNAYSWVTRRLFDIPAHDITNAFRGMRRDLPLAAGLTSRDFAISPELAIKARRIGARITEIPTVYSYRQNGDSHFKIFRMGWKYARLYVLVLARPRGRIGES